jgi:4'-phosphopantetheinyl transferase
MSQPLAEALKGCAVPRDEVHVWLAHVGWPPLRIDALSDVLSPPEQQNVERFRFQADRERYVIGRGLARVVLGRVLAAKPESLRFDCNAFGKPFLVEALNAGRLQFNVSHSGDIVLVAVTAGRQIGVDVERIRDDVEIDDITERFFSSREQADLAALPLHERRDAFFRCWSRKEALIKARGEGLSLPLHRFDVSVGPREPPLLLATRPDPAEAGRWAIQDVHVGAGYAASVAVEGRDWKLKICHCGLGDAGQHDAISWNHGSSG